LFSRGCVAVASGVLVEYLKPKPRVVKADGKIAENTGAVGRIEARESAFGVRRQQAWPKAGQPQCSENQCGYYFEVHRIINRFHNFFNSCCVSEPFVHG